ncbi:tRNA (guanosine(37)-N1)-methyltransferase TrmD [Candidatus Dojkabacteria bacterium]|nr:tRNA (guanosine(37)-N1)-methyltransferase TrmD [Candidatus Dojkabacteria bacterium]
MKIDIVTLFPKMFYGPFSESIIGKAQENDLIEIEIHNLRDWGLGNYNQVDNKPFGGGGGMVIMIEPVYKCLNQIKKNAQEVKNPKVIALSAKGEPLKQSKVKQLSNEKHLIFLAGHYEGFDQRILDYLVDLKISIGNYVLTGGEIPAMVLTDAIVRLIPGVVGNDTTPTTDSYFKDDQSRQYPQYTRPAEFKMNNGQQLNVPDVLISGDHGKIKKWKKENIEK